MEKDLKINQGLNFEQTPKGLIGNIEPIFFDYGYQSLDALCIELSQSLRKGFNDFEDISRPSLVIFVAEPGSGKSHLAREVASRLYRLDNPTKNTSLVWDIYAQGEVVDADAVYWGDCISGAKLDHEIDMDKTYDQLNRKDVNAASDKLAFLVSLAIKEKKSSPHLILAEAPAVSATMINGQLYGVNLGNSALNEIARHSGQFSDLDYDAFFVGFVAGYDIKRDNKRLRDQLDGAGEDVEKIRQLLIRRGEDVVYKNKDDGSRRALLEYTREAADSKSCLVIEQQVDRLLIKAAEENVITLRSGAFYVDCLTREVIFNPEERERALGHLLRKNFEVDFGIKEKVFLGRNMRSMGNVPFDLTTRIRNVARAYYGDRIDLVKNKSVFDHVAKAADGVD